MSTREFTIWLDSGNPGERIGLLPKRGQERITRRLVALSENGHLTAEAMASIFPRYPDRHVYMTLERALTLATIEFVRRNP